MAGEDFISRYLNYTSNQVSPKLFHLWVAVATIGAAMGRKVSLDRGGYFRTYPGQMMVVLVSKSATAKKTTAGNLGMRLLKVLDPTTFYMLPSKTSPQQLLHSLQRLGEDKLPMKWPDGRRVDSCGFIWAGELGKFFSKESFAETLATHINDLNDCPDGRVKLEFRSEKKPWTLWNPCVGLLGCITPKGMSEELPSTARTAGFFGRVLWVCQNYTDRENALVDRPPQLDDLRLELEEELKRIAAMEGPFGWTKQGKQFFKDWYATVYMPSVRKFEDEGANESGYWGRKDSHLTRVAMIVSAARRNDPDALFYLKLTQADVETALAYLDEIEHYFPQAMAEIGVSNWQEYERKVLGLLETKGDGKGWVSQERLLTHLWRYGGLARFQQACDILLPAQEMERKRFPDEEVYYRRKYKMGAALRRGREEQAGDKEKGENDDHEDD